MILGNLFVVCAVLVALGVASAAADMPPTPQATPQATQSTQRLAPIPADTPRHGEDLEVLVPWYQLSERPSVRSIFVPSSKTMFGGI